MAPARLGSTQKRGEETRKLIVTMARRLFSELGYHRTGIGDIQSATGLTKGAFYHHFPTKEDVALAVLDAAECDYAECVFAPVMDEPDPEARIRRLFERLVSLNSTAEWSNCQMILTLAAELTEADERLRARILDMQTQWFAYWKGLLAEAQQANQLRDGVDVDVWTQWILNTLAGTLVAKKLGSTQVPPADVVQTLEHSLFKPKRQETDED